MTSPFEEIPEGIADLADQFENLQRQAEHIESQFYDNHPGLAAFHLLQPFDETTVRRVIDNAANAYGRCVSSYPPVEGLPGSRQREDQPVVRVFAPALPRQVRELRDGVTFDTVLADVRSTPHCDFQLRGPGCVPQLEAAERNLGKRSVAQYVLSLPVARGDVIFVIRACLECWRKYLEDNDIDVTKTAVLSEFSDGGGGAGALDPGEHPWRGEIQ